MSNGLAVMIGVGIGAVIVIGSYIYYEYTERQNRYNHSNQGSRPRSRERPSQPSGARCGRCKLPFVRQDIERLPCRHIFHSVCLLQVDVCPIPDCGQKIPGDFL